MTIDIERIHGGWSVYGNDGGKIGTVYEAGPDYILIDRGLLGTKHLHVPVSAIEKIESERVYLNVPEYGIDELGWDEMF